MNTNREILCSSKGQNPNFFQVKLPKNIAIHPNSEIALIKGRVHHDLSTNFSDNNNTFTLLWGQYDMKNNGTTGTSPCTWLTPEEIKLKNGVWSHYSSNAGDIAGDSSEITFTNKTILNNLIDSLNEQTLYFNWQWSGIYVTRKTISIYGYICEHTSGSCSFVPSLLNDGEPLDISIIPANPGVHPSLNSFTTNNAGGYLAYTNSRCTLAYSIDILPDADVDVPRKWHSLTLPVQANPNINRIFGGVILSHQETYKQNEMYSPSKDWCKIPLNDLGQPDMSQNASNYINNMPISYEINGNGEIIFTRREILDNGLVGEIKEIIPSGEIYDGTAERVITLNPKILSENNITKTKVECLVDGVVVNTFELDESYHRYELKHALCIDCDFTPLFAGIDESRYVKNSPTTTLGLIDRPTSGAVLGNINLAIIFGSLNVDEIMNLRPDTVVNEDFHRRTQSNNSLIFFDQDLAFYFINGQVADIDNQVPIFIGNQNSFLEMPNLHIGIENLPLNEFLASGLKGEQTYRIYSHYDENGVVTDVIDPHNIIYHKLHNKQTIMLDNFRIRITDDDNATYESLIGTTLLNIHIRTNPHKMLQALTGAIRTMSQKKETVDNTEQIQELSYNIF